MHKCVFSSGITDALVLMHLTTSIHSGDKLFIVLDQFYTKYYL